MSTTLQTNIRNSRNVTNYIFGSGQISELTGVLAPQREIKNAPVVFFVDDFFTAQKLPAGFDGYEDGDSIIFIDTKAEPTTDYINTIRDQVVASINVEPCAVVGIGGGITMDVCKGVSNLLTNGGQAEDYQGWDLVKVPGVYKVGIPTLSGTGAEATRTCVMTNTKNGLKLGMNSNFTVFDQIIIDPNLTKTVPDDQFFYTGMDTYIHCIESLAGQYRNTICDAMSEKALDLSREVFLSEDMKSDACREALMVASYFGGAAIANSYVGVVHPFSAALSVVLKLHHGVANCITMRVMDDFYPKEFDEFWKMAERHGQAVPEGMCKGLSDEQYQALYDSTIIHEKPLTNALGDDFRQKLGPDRVIDLFKRM